MKFKALFLMMFLLLPLMSASVQINPANNVEQIGSVNKFYFLKDDVIDFKTPCFNGGDYCNSSVVCSINILNPSSEYLVENGTMTNNNEGIFNYTLPDTSLIGNYQLSISCCDGGSCGNFIYNYDVNSSGQKLPDDFLLSLFIFIFIFILYISSYQIVNLIGLWRELNIDVTDVSKIMGIYFVLFAYKYFTQIYWNDAMVQTMINIFLSVGAFTHIIIPLMALGASMIYNPLRKEVQD